MCQHTFTLAPSAAPHHHQLMVILLQSCADQGGADKAMGRAAEPPGPDFLHQLREYTEAFRYFRLHLGPGGELLSASSVKGHLGLKS